MFNPLRPEIGEIRAYTRAHPELSSAHHFLYDLPLAEGMQSVKFVVIGMNPGEAARDGLLKEGPTEETSEFDFHKEHGRSRAQIPWTRQSHFILGTDQTVQSEFFFWSSPNMEVFEQRYGPMLYSPHLSFCTRLNKRLIEQRQPSAVVCPGLSIIPIAYYEYGLTHVRTARDATTHRLVEHFHDGERPWFFTKHWTGARGFSTDQKTQIRDYIGGEVKRLP